LIIGAYRVVSLSVVFFCGYNVPLGADINAEMAFLAEFFINFYGAFQSSIPEKYYIVRIFRQQAAKAMLRKTGRKSSIFK
jgi:hypothetical protein